jgi:hypothetical protein
VSEVAGKSGLSLSPGWSTPDLLALNPGHLLGALSLRAKFSMAEKVRFEDRFDELWSDKAMRSINARARGKDHTGVVIEIHLRLEHTIVEILNARLAKPMELNVDELNFYTKVNVAAACGFLHRKEAILYVNRIRNKVAHNLDFKVTADMAFHLEKLAYSQRFDDEEVREIPPLKRFVVVASFLGGLIVGSNIAMVELGHDPQA